MTEQEIIKGSIKGNREAQKAFYEHFYGRLMGLCLRYSHNTKEAKEVMHQGFLKLFDTLRHIKESDFSEAWMKKIFIATSLEHTRKNKQNLMIVSTVNATKKLAEASEVEDENIFLNLDKELFLKAIQELSPGYRAVYNLSVVDGYSLKEVAEMMEVSEDTSRLNLSNAKYAFRKHVIELLTVGNG